MARKCVLGECMLWKRDVHGWDKESSKNINTQWIYHNDLEVEELPTPSFPWLRIEIAELNYLEREECTAIFKTFWLKIVQRAWKRIYKKRKEIIDKRKSFSAIKYREIHGKWPDNLNYLPSIKDIKI